MKREERQAIAAARLEQMVLSADPTVNITLDKKRYTLEYDNHAVKGIFKATGVNLIENWFTGRELNDPEVVSQVLYFGLKRHHPDITLDAVDSMYRMRFHLYVLGRVRVALDVFSPDLDDLEPVDKEEATASQDPTKQPTEHGSDTCQSA